MAAAGKTTRQAADDVDLAALKLMLAYVEAECRRLGAPHIAAHVAQAASLFPAGLAAASASPQAADPSRLH